MVRVGASLFCQEIQTHYDDYSDNNSIYQTPVNGLTPVCDIRLWWNCRDECSVFSLFERGSLGLRIYSANTWRASFRGGGGVYASFRFPVFKHVLSSLYTSLVSLTLDKRHDKAAELSL